MRFQLNEQRVFNVNLGACKSETQAKPMDPFAGRELETHWPFVQLKKGALPLKAQISERATASRVQVREERRSEKR